MRLLLTALLALTLAACGAARQPSATPPPAPTVPAVGELLSSPVPGQVQLTGYLLITPEGAVLVDGLSFADGPPPTPLDSGRIWLGDTPAIAPDTPLSVSGATQYAVVTAAGQLEGPGRFGPDGAYPYRLAEPEVKPLSVRDLGLRLLLDNSGLYTGQPVRLQGQLLSSPDGAVLVERLGAGGVPEATALQIKLAPAIHDTALLDSLTRAGNGAVRFGAVEVTGIWRGDRLYPLAITTR